MFGTEKLQLTKTFNGKIGAYFKLFPSSYPWLIYRKKISVNSAKTKSIQFRNTVKISLQNYYSFFNKNIFQMNIFGKEMNLSRYIDISFHFVDTLFVSMAWVFMFESLIIINGYNISIGETYF